ncbi:DNA-binding transcriptional regulator, AcrR family [Salinihabitans flavidus]|uniref:DNA-binding transcriptional regulator, AcrR family n=1 Tax=Salinihabitans flavidus TaxID=569882 RepID=A0A1H8VRI0_9RHOB|nr:TetR/AcrR family transcriptional regulator [Salinihabitans flavidus]SEP17934.1 DNA-binding transcriptional regulator, AcrR family [Salinihabitans flavidus]
MSGHRKSAKDRRAEIVDVTLRLLTETPVEKLSTSRIAEEIGITQAAIFRHFQTKDVLWRAVLEEVELRATRAWDTAAAEELTPIARLRAILKAQLSLIAAIPAIPVLIFSAGQIAAETAIRPIHLRVMQGLRARILAQLRAAAASGEIIARLPEDHVDLFLGLLQGTVLRWRLSGEGFDLVAEGMRLVEIQIGLMTGTKIVGTT